MGSMSDTLKDFPRGSGVIVTIRYPDYEKIPVSSEVRAVIETLEGRSCAPPA